MADTYRSASLLAQRPVSGPAAPLEQWWRGFHDPLLDQVVNEALAQNLDIAAAGARVDQSRSAARAAGAQLLPVGQASADAARQRQSLRSPTGQLFSHFPGYQRTGSLYELNAGAAWEIDLFGQLRRGAEAARADAAAAEAGRAGARLTIAAETVDTYIQIRALQARLARLQQRVAAAELAERLTEQKFHDGVASDIERQQIRAQAAQARAALPLLRTGLEAQMNRLDVLLAQPAGHNRARLEGGDAVIPSPPSIAAGDGPAELLRRRPDLIAAERRLAADNARIGVALADYWPHVSLSGLAGFEATRSGDLTTGPAQLAAGRAATAWRLFDFGRVDAEVKAARAKRTEALALWKQAVLQAGAEVEDATVALVSREQHAAELDRALTAARTAEQLVSQSVDAGAASQLDLALARSQRLQAEDAELEARSDAARSAVALCRALGGGWSPRG